MNNMNTTKINRYRPPPLSTNACTNDEKHVIPYLSTRN